MEECDHVELLRVNDHEAPLILHNMEPSNEQNRAFSSISVPNVVSTSTIQIDRDTNNNDFQSPLVLNSKRKRDPSTQGSDSEDDETICQCPICFENWSNTGAHRIVSMKCGHLFGLRYE
jgi:E3 ubiquitin-protein ligase RFWD3